MKMVRLFAPSTQGPGHEIELVNEPAHILSRVLRLKPGQRVSLLDGQGGSRVSELISLKRNRAMLRVISVQTEARPDPEITLGYALPKGEKASEVIRRSVEWGVGRIVFAESEFSVAKASFGQHHRWERVAQEAMRQSGNPYLPEIVGPVSFQELKRRTQADMKLMFDTDRSAQGVTSILGNRPKTVSVLVGPEGGWSDSEREELEAEGFLKICLGPYVLRTENAALSAVALIRSLFFEKMRS